LSWSTFSRANEENIVVIKLFSYFSFVINLKNKHMKQKLFLSITLVLVVVLKGFSQINGPTTAVAGTPVTFTSAVNGQFYTWVTDTMNYSGDFIPTSVTIPGTGANNFVKMVKDGANYHAFYFTNSASELRRLDFGTNPNSTPTLNSNVVAVPDIHGSSNNKSIDIVRDSATGNWYGFFAGNRKVCRADFGPSITSTPTITTIMNLPAATSVHGGDFVVVKDNGNWYGFLSCNMDGAPQYGIIRIKFGSSLANNSPTELTPSVKRISGGGDNHYIVHFTLHREGGNWYLLATQLNDASNSQTGRLMRFDLGTSLESAPSDATILLDGGFLGGNQQPRSVIVLSDCNELVVYAVNANTPYAGSQGMFVKFDFKGSILNTPVITRPTGAANLNVACTNLSPYVYNDTLCFIAPQWQGSTAWTRFKTVPLPAGKHTTKHQDSSFTHTFTTPGTYNITLNVDMGAQTGPRTFCHQITVNPPGPVAPPQPGNFLNPVRNSVCKVETGVEYRINRVAGADTYTWTYAPSTGVTINQIADTLVRLDFSASASSGTLSVVANNVTGSSPARTLSVTVNNRPTVALSPTGTQAICQGKSLLLTATATGVDYQWLNANTAVGTNASTYTATTAGTYRVAVTSQSTGCSDTSGTLTLTVNPVPSTALNHTGPINICGNDSLVLVAPSGSGYSYQWRRDGISLGAGSAQYTAKQSGIYRVVVSNANCSDTSDPVDLKVHPLPLMTLVPDDTAFCDGEAAMLNVITADTGLTFTWRRDGVVIPLATADFLSIQDGGTYVVTAERAILNGCSGTTNPAVITVYPLPVVDISWDGLDLVATSGFAGYQWHADTQPVPGATNSVFRPGTNGRYVVRVTDSNGCTATAARNLQNVSVSDVASVEPVRVYPNPASASFTVQAQVPVTLRLFGMDGKLIRERVNADNMEIGDLSDGIYLLQVYDAQGQMLLRERLAKAANVR
jgi:hypothetical protein